MASLLLLLGSLLIVLVSITGSSSFLRRLPGTSTALVAGRTPRHAQPGGRRLRPPAWSRPGRVTRHAMMGDSGTTNSEVVRFETAPHMEYLMELVQSGQTFAVEVDLAVDIRTSDEEMTSAVQEARAAVFEILRNALGPTCMDFWEVKEDGVSGLAVRSAILAGIEGAIMLHDVSQAVGAWSDQAGCSVTGWRVIATGFQQSRLRDCDGVLFQVGHKCMHSEGECFVMALSPNEVTVISKDGSNEWQYTQMDVIDSCLKVIDK
eukprot:TRINITY_DN37700_c0_g1_i1.p1 TRINITY_DN37700_c0_g1~~TRINITY_DN37700_c0_g1_i1.p1  ORF type:complete len:263 (+),score=39.39 TRINITY_DN37700_c0_g1_i1:109-897(+)